MLLERVSNLEQEYAALRADLNQQAPPLHPLCSLSMSATTGFRFTAFEDAWLSRSAEQRNRALVEALPPYRGLVRIMHCHSRVTAACELELRTSMCTQDSDAVPTPADLDALLWRPVVLIEGVVVTTDCKLPVELLSHSLVESWGATFTPADPDLGLYNTASLQNPICCLMAFSQVCQQRPEFTVLPCCKLWFELIAAATNEKCCYAKGYGKAGMQLRAAENPGFLSAESHAELDVLVQDPVFLHPRIQKLIALGYV